MLIIVRTVCTVCTPGPYRAVMKTENPCSTEFRSLEGAPTKGAREREIAVISSTVYMSLNHVTDDSILHNIGSATTLTVQSEANNF